MGHAASRGQRCDSNSQPCRCETALLPAEAPSYRMSQSVVMACSMPLWWAAESGTLKTDVSATLARSLFARCRMPTVLTQLMIC